MKKYFGLFACAALLTACGLKEKPQPDLLTDVVMPPHTWVFAPGEGVTVRAQGFEAGDEIVLDIEWKNGDGEFAPEGFARGVWGVITDRTATSLTFLAPGHYPASTVGVSLRRAGRTMPLGSIAVSDGRPEQAELYGVTASDADATAIVRIDRNTGAATPVVKLDAGQKLSCAVNAFGSGCIYGISADGAEALYDLTMHYHATSSINSLLTACPISDAQVVFLRYEDERLDLISQSLTRSSGISATQWRLPEGVTPERIEKHPFVRVQNAFLLTVDHGDGSRSPMGLSLYGKTGLGEAVEADAMIPFRTLTASALEPDKWEMTGGYALSKDGTTQLRLFDPDKSRELGKTLAEVPGTVLSVTEAAPDVETLEIYLLCQVGGVRRIHVYDAVKKTLRTLPGETTCSEIVMAK